MAWLAVSFTVDAARVELLLSELRLPAIKLMWAALAARADKEGWPAARFLAALAEHEVADRGRRRIERHLASARLPAGKTFDTFNPATEEKITSVQESGVEDVNRPTYRHSVGRRDRCLHCCVHHRLLFADQGPAAIVGSDASPRFLRTGIEHPDFVRCQSG